MTQLGDLICGETQNLSTKEPTNQRAFTFHSSVSIPAVVPLCSPFFMASPACDDAEASTLVLTNRALFRYIMGFIDGVPGSVVSLVTAFQRRHRGVPWSDTGALIRTAIQSGDFATLCYLRQLSMMKSFQFCPELVLDGAIRCAIQFGRLEMLKYLIEMMVRDTKTGTEMSTLGSTLMGWAIKYSDVLPRSSKLDIIEWVAGNYSKSTLRNVQAEDLSRASVRVLAFLKEKHVGASGFEDPKLVDLVATMGKLETLRFLLERHNEHDDAIDRTRIQCTQDAMDGAAANGHLEIVQYLHHLGTMGCTVAAMDGAARNGHLEIVRFLHCHRTEGCTIAAMDDAACNGYLEIVQFLHVNRSEGCSTAAMDGAATGGFLNVVQFLHEKRTENCTTKAMDGAARNGHFPVVQFLHTQRQEGCTTDAMDGAALVGRLSMIQFLHENRNEGGTTRAIDGAVWRGHVHVVAFLLQNRLEGCTSKALDTACQHGYMEIVRVLHESGKASCTPAAMDMAASNGHFEIVQYLQDNRVEGCTENAMTNAAINGHTDVVCFLGEHRHEGIHDFALERTAAQGHVECVQALIRYSMRGCLFEARRAALEAAYPEVAEVLSTYINPDVRACSAKYHRRPFSPRWCQKQPQPQQSIIEAGADESRKEHASGSQFSAWWWWCFQWL